MTLAAIDTHAVTLTLIGLAVFAAMVITCLVGAIHYADKGHKQTRDGRDDPESWRKP